MRLTALILLTAILQVSANTYGQKITLSEKNTALDKVFDKIRLQSGFDFVFTTSTMKHANPVDINIRNTDLKDALKLVFEKQPLNYSIEGKSVIISPKVKSFLDKIVDAFDAIEVKGKVIDENGKPLARATIKIKNEYRFTYTNDYGEFKMTGVDESATLIISFLGYENKEIKAAKELGNIQLVEASGKLQEVVVSTGYQLIDKSKMTGSSAKVEAKDLVINGTTTLEQSLQGKLAGLEVVNNTGMVGTRQTVRVRGTSTLLGSQEPVWVVDGIIQEDPLPFKAAELNRFGKDPSNETALKNFVGSTISWLNPYDIQDITVLKDAASTAIYGVKAANGVIVINTKRGQTGRAPSVTYSNSFSTQSKYSYDKLELMNSKERVDVSREVWERGLISSYSLDEVGFQGILKQYLAQKISYDQFNSGVKQLEVNNTDWLDILFQTPLNQNHNISISGGGNGGGSYFGSFGYNNQKGLAKGNGLKGYNGNVSFTSNISSKLVVSARISGNYSKTEGFKGTDPYQYATSTNRAIPAYNEDGTLSYYRYGNFQYNILNELANSGNDNIKTSLNATVNATYKLPVGFRFESVLGLSYSGTHGETYATDQTNEITARRRYEYGAFSPETYEYKSSPLPVGGVLSTLESRNTNYTWRNGLTYGTTINQKHSISGMMGMELRSNMYQGSLATSYGYLPGMGKIIVNPPLTTLNGTTYIPNSIIYDASTHTITDQKANYVSYYLTGGYTYDNRYVFSASVRGDASNRFGQDKRSRFKPVWALGARWNVAREHWFDQNTWFNDFSIRTSFGHQGNVAENYGPDLITKMGGLNTLTGEALLNISNLPYTNLRMEKTQTIDLGVDFGFFKNRVTGSVDYYHKKSKDLIVLLDVPFENGVSQMPVNNGNMINSGFDLALNFIPARNGNFTWTVGFNFSKNYNKVESKLLPNPTWNNATSGTYNVEGFPVSSFWVFDYKGLNATTGLPMYNIPTGTDNLNARTDASAYMVYGGKLNADFNTGINTSFRYKNLTLSTNMYLSVGGKKILAPVYTDITNNTPNEYNNLPKILVDRWRKPGDELTTNVPALPYFGIPFISIPGEVTTYSPYVLYNFSTLRVVSASYLRISNINLSYTLPDSFCKRILTKSVTLGYSLSNPYTFVSKDYKGLDPEVASGNQPLPRIHVLNMAVTF
ncbi:SusC/RagA family TonB-linked outer membrane protein [Pedobacter punctiformis]|uniref:SusC/RagA family TonB-linked outer membrane protein n=1 Tax=Pedobacter punctiformis TaxID=3004097 RepID=A0ABT4LB42_9SPHI|nr:SusC/RagA family TonB-linked outer membrane protein [Pedobacter sp. HCMS5-2]MCZ4245123.1 SusC/RagA family TonB-linked outer membrane protein [Pedobacter sp. HCMS5-2]